MQLEALPNPECVAIIYVSWKAFLHSVNVQKGETYLTLFLIQVYVLYGRKPHLCEQHMRAAGATGRAIGIYIGRYLNLGA